MAGTADGGTGAGSAFDESRPSRLPGIVGVQRARNGRDESEDSGGGAECGAGQGTTGREYAACCGIVPCVYPFRVVAQPFGF